MPKKKPKEKGGLAEEVRLKLQKKAKKLLDDRFDDCSVHVVGKQKVLSDLKTTHVLGEN
ncbi:hypothetical protein KAI65_02185 [Candidatus Parcubacteria bacterium]|nr:hypothetical protein [Candidatus Parcubacteria bacterium]